MSYHYVPQQDPGHWFSSRSPKSEKRRERDNVRATHCKFGAKQGKPSNKTTTVQQSTTENYPTKKPTNVPVEPMSNPSVIKENNDSVACQKPAEKEPTLNETLEDAIKQALIQCESSFPALLSSAVPTPTISSSAVVSNSESVLSSLSSTMVETVTLENNLQSHIIDILARISPNTTNPP